MKTKTINICKFDELFTEIQEKVINDWRRDNYNHTPPFINEANDSFDKFAEIFSINWNNIDYEEPYRNEYTIKLNDDILNLSGVPLVKHIWNNYKSDIFKGKYYGKLVDTFSNGAKIPISKDHPIGKRIVQRYSRVFLSNDCILTGVCYDNNLLNPIYEYLNKPNDRVTFETLLNDCIYSLCHAVTSEIEYENSDEAIKETIRINDYDFTEDGEIA